MPNKYSTGYGLAPNSTTPQYLYRGPHIERAGQTVLRCHTFTGALTFNAAAAVNDVLFIAGGFVAGEKIKRLVNVRSADPDAANDFTFNLGWRIGTAATPVSAFAATSTAMQAAVALDLAEAVLIPLQAAAEGDDLILTCTAGAAEVTTVVYSFLIESWVPGA